MRPLPRVRSSAAALVLPLLLALLLAGGCSGGDARDPQAALDAAAQRLDDAETLHVGIAGASLPDSGTVLVSADGDAERPDRFSGTLQVRVSGATADVDVLSTDGQVYAKLPFSTGLTAVDPAQFGLPDPGTLVGAETGVSRLLDAAEAVASQPAEREGGEVLDIVTAELPGQLVGELLTNADPAQPVQARFAVARETDELRSVQLTGPFYAAAARTRYTVTLTDYDEAVEIPAAPSSAPSGG